jgi:hypothetical protein
LPKLKKHKLRQQPLKPKLRSTRLRSKLGLQSPPRRNPWKPEEKGEAHHYAQKLKYPKGALIFNGSGEEDFLYCLPDSKEIYVCREMARSFGFPTLEDGLSVLSKDELADSLAYNSLKVRE